jgi:hypothetical protein
MRDQVAVINSEGEALGRLGQLLAGPPCVAAVTPEPGQQGPREVETKYRCKACKHEWRVRGPRLDG